MSVSIFCISIIIISYCFYILNIVFYFKKNKHKIGKYNTSISIIIPCRNEAENIIKCLKSINNQSLQNNHYEVIVIDDNSQDDTFTMASNFKAIANISVVKNNLVGKKNALSLGISLAKNNIILTTDADCTMHPNWAETMRNIFEENKLNMLCGNIQFTANGSIFTQLQQAESAAIVGISATMLNLKKPTTCNGANLMFSKTLFETLGGYKQHLSIATGDDDLLLQEFFKLDKEKVAYTLNANTLVSTQPSYSFNQFIMQRKRWIAKHNLYIYPYNKLLQVFITIQLIAIYAALCLFTPYALVLIGLKYTVDIIYGLQLKPYFKFNLFIIFIIPFYQVYIFILLILSPFIKTEWKGRSLN